MSLVVDFTGLCAVVPVAANRAAILFPNFSQPVDIHGEKIIPGHRAYIQFSSPKITMNKVARRRPNFVVIPRRSPGSRVKVLLLRGEEISLVPEPFVHPTGVKMDLSRVVDMTQVIRDDQIDDALVLETFDPDASRITARLFVERGELRMPETLGRTLEFVPRLDPLRPYRGEFVENIVWELPPAIYNLTSRAFGARTGTEVAQWQIDASATRVYLHMGNLPLEDICDPASPRAVEADKELIDHHFHRFYELCAKFPETHPLPRRVSASSTRVRLMGGNCPPVKFSK